MLDLNRVQGVRQNCKIIKSPHLLAIDDAKFIRRLVQRVATIQTAITTNQKSIHVEILERLHCCLGRGRPGIMKEEILRDNARGRNLRYHIAQGKEMW